MGGNLERNRWLIVDDADLKARIAERFAEVGRPYLAANASRRPDDRSRRVMASAGQAAAYYGSVLPGVWSFQLAARARGIGSAWTTFHLEHEAEISALLGIPETVTQVCLLAVGYYTGDAFTPAPRRPATDVTYLNGWKRPVTEV